MCRRKRKNAQLVNWQFPPLYDSGTAPTLRYKRINLRTAEWLEVEREMFTQGDTEQVPKVIMSDYRKERSYSAFMCREYVSLIHQAWNQRRDERCFNKISRKMKIQLIVYIYPMITCTKHFII